MGVLEGESGGSSPSVSMVKKKLGVTNPISIAGPTESDKLRIGEGMSLWGFRICFVFDFVCLIVFLKFLDLCLNQ